MKRKEFIRLCGILGIGIPLQSSLYSCNGSLNPSDFSGSVIIIGAGAAGMTAAYLLEKAGVDYRVLEASSVYGGRMKRSNDFVDFPIPLGAEWLHVSPDRLDTILEDPFKEVNIDFQAYSSDQTVDYFEDGALIQSTISEEFGNQFIDQKFIGSSWFDFYENYVLPSIASKIQYDHQIVSIDYDSDKVIVQDQNSLSFEADKVIIAVPLKILQEEIIDFIPALPTNRIETIQDATFWGGIKIFIEFQESFYASYLNFSDTETNEGQRLYYDAAYGQNSDRHVLGLFAVGKQAEAYQNLDGEALRDYVLAELDVVYNGLASQHYIKHMVQDWNKEKFIQGAYLADTVSYLIPGRLAESIDDKLYFAGEAYSDQNDWGGVHNAAQSAKKAVNEIL